MEEFLFTESCIHFYPIQSAKKSSKLSKKSPSKSKSAKTKGGKKLKSRKSVTPKRERNSNLMPVHKALSKSKSAKKRKKRGEEYSFAKRINSDAVLMNRRFKNG